MIQRFLAELQRRKVLRVAATYLVGAWIVLQVAVALQSAIALSSQFSAAILALLVIGFPVAVALAWFFEITPEGVKRTSPATGDGALVKPQTTDLILAGALLLVVVVAVAQWFVPQVTAPAAPTTTTAQTAPAKPEPPALGDKSIAVLPFANLSPDKDDAYFADGLTEEVTTALAQVRGAKVISRTSSSAFQGKNTPLPEIAKVLGVRYMLEGSVRREGDNVRVTAQLIDVPTDTHVWSKTFEPSLEHVFAVQDDIARAIALALELEMKALVRAPGAPTQNAEAYRLWLKGLETVRRQERGFVSDAVDLFKRATELDPEFAAAQASLAMIYTAAAVNDPSVRKTALPLAKEAAARAAKLKPNLAAVHAALGAVAHYELRWEDAIRESFKATERDPSLAIGHILRGPTLERVGRFRDAARVVKEGQSLDPLNPDFGLIAVLMALDRGDDGTVEAAARRLVGSSRETGIWGHFLLTKLAQDNGDHATAEKEFRAFMAGKGTNKDITEPVSGALKSKASLKAAIEALRAEAAKDPTFEIAEFLSLVDPKGAWIDELNARIAEGETLSVAWRIGSVWRLVAQGEGDNPKVKALMRNAGLVDYWKKHGWPDRCRATATDDFECS